MNVNCKVLNALRIVVVAAMNNMHILQVCSTLMSSHRVLEVVLAHSTFFPIHYCLENTFFSPPVDLPLFY